MTREAAKEIALREVRKQQTVQVSLSTVFGALALRGLSWKHVLAERVEEERYVSRMLSRITIS